MFYRFLNKPIFEEISNLQPKAMKFLSDDQEKSDNETVARRLDVFRNYTLLLKHYQGNQKQLYMINKNFRSFLKAIIFLYQTSEASVSVGVLTAPAGIYYTINAVQESFEEAVTLLPHK